MLMRKISNKKMLLAKEEKGGKKTRILITINVLGSTGPLRLVVNDDDTVSNVIDSSLKLYARGGRLPVLGSDFKNFTLYPSNAPSDALSSSEAIGLCGGRNFVLSKKTQLTKTKSATITRQADSRSWKAWFNGLNKSFKIISH